MPTQHPGTEETLIIHAAFTLLKLLLLGTGDKHRTSSTHLLRLREDEVKEGSAVEPGEPGTGQSYTCWWLPP